MQKLEPPLSINFSPSAPPPSAPLIRYQTPQRQQQGDRRSGASLRDIWGATRRRSCRRIYAAQTRVRCCRQWSSSKTMWWRGEVEKRREARQGGVAVVVWPPPCLGLIFSIAIYFVVCGGDGWMWMAVCVWRHG
ncbi:Hypothetical predicted protein [Olea europaea subsp. europaea]|uniref:Uncharacterized protein n=1 Tax=Olea europaea subsp. europaea TaxID=158383 RepID=A0A8S0UAH4_OLEEU|nr:Hypothetical predicted protein [Olea europaea subsp. europaea]